MQATLTPPPTPENPYKEQLAYLRIAIWMVDFRNRFPPANQPVGRYGAVLRHLQQAFHNANNPHRNNLKPVSVPGGPALRLAKAIWAYEYRILYPDNLQLKLKEERNSAHLEYFHRNNAKNSPVWKAMEYFLKRRKDTLGGIPVPAAQKEDIFQPNPFTKALRLLDGFIEDNRRLRQRLIFPETLAVIANAPLDNQAVLLAMVNALSAYAHWLVSPSNVTESKNLTISYEALIGAQYENMEYLRTVIPLSKSIHQLRYVLDQARV